MKLKLLTGCYSTPSGYKYYSKYEFDCLSCELAHLSNEFSNCYGWEFISHYLAYYPNARFILVECLKINLPLSSSYIECPCASKRVSKTYLAWREQLANKIPLALTEANIIL